MAAPQSWLSRMNKELKKTPLAVNLIFSLLLAVVEKIAEVQFTCPCNPEYNYKFAVAFFAIPSVLILLLFLIAQEWKRDCLLCCKNIIISPFPVMVWLVLLFVDGQYYACSKTSWSGRFVRLDQDYPQKWCQPGDQNLTQKYMTKTREFFSYSQDVGIIIACVLTAVLVPCAIYYIYCSCSAGSDRNEGTNTELEDLQDPVTILQ